MISVSPRAFPDPYRDCIREEQWDEDLVKEK